MGASIVGSSVQSYRLPRNTMTEPEVESITPTPTPPTESQPSRTASGGRSARILQQHPKKRFSSFLSHFKREAGTEARLVQMQLREILESEKDIFLDSGRACL